MSTSAHARLLIEILEAHGLKASMVLRLADSARADLKIWPFAVDEIRVTSNRQVPGPGQERKNLQSIHRQTTRFLLLPSTVGTYDQARKILLDNPWVGSEDPPGRVTVEGLSIADATALFIASGVNQQLALHVSIE